MTATFFRDHRERLVCRGVVQIEKLELRVLHQVALIICTEEDSYPRHGNRLLYEVVAQIEEFDVQVANIAFPLMAEPLPEWNAKESFSNDSSWPTFQSGLKSARVTELKEDWRLQERLSDQDLRHLTMNLRESSDFLSVGV